MLIIFSAIIALTSLQSLREKASRHAERRDECFRKAKQAYNRGSRTEAKEYSNDGHFHTGQLKAANREAAEEILKDR